MPGNTLVVQQDKLELIVNDEVYQEETKRKKVKPRKLGRRKIAAIEKQEKISDKDVKKDKLNFTQSIEEITKSLAHLD